MQKQHEPSTTTQSMDTSNADTAKKFLLIKIHSTVKSSFNTKAVFHKTAAFMYKISHIDLDYKNDKFNFALRNESRMTFLQHSISSKIFHSILLVTNALKYWTHNHHNFSLCVLSAYRKNRYQN